MTLRATLGIASRKLGFTKHPMQRVLRTLESKGYDLSSMSQLELFGGKGEVHLVEISKKLGKVKVWEYDQGFVDTLKANFKDADIHCVDSYSAIKAEKETYDMIISDNPMQTEAGHIEHFDLFPYITNLLKDNSVLIISIIPNPSAEQLSYYPKLLNPKHVAARKEFYKCHDPKNITTAEFNSAFAEKLSISNLDMPWSFIQKRNDLLSYFVCGIKKKSE